MGNVESVEGSALDTTLAASVKGQYRITDGEPASNVATSVLNRY